MEHPASPLRIGLISDTHGLLRPQALEAMAGCDRLVHAGDIGSAVILETLAGIAPLTAVRGNNDRDDWGQALPEAVTVELGGIRLYVLHDLKQLAIDPRAEGIDVVVAGHSHKAMVERRDAVLYVNPGSAGPRRFSLPVSVAHLRIGADGVEAEILPLAG